ncbi:MAG: CocE/NonD family hydrolase, partial [Pseudomonadota bacterium]
DNQELEARKDVFCYTSEIFDADLVLMGEPELILFVQSSNAHTDFFGRICDVYPDGRSINVTDGLVRIHPGDVEPQADGTLKITIKLWPTAHAFVRGNRLRLQVSSGAHPRWGRNLGTGEDPLESAELVVANQSLFHDVMHKSHLKVPTYQAIEVD